jgi:GT2 family glycosyltransferase
VKTDSKADITVIIPSWNQKTLLERCLSSLHEQTADCLVTVVDNGSIDGSQEMLKSCFPDVSSIRLEQNVGFARACNLAIKEARTPYVALLNNDTEAHPEWIEAGLRAFSRYPDDWFFATRMIQFFDRGKLDSAGDLYTRTGLPLKRGLGEPPGTFPAAEPVLGASAGAAFYRRELFDRVGYFDEEFFMYLEDVDFSLRAQLAGYPCRYLPDAMVYHMEAASDPERKLNTDVSSRIFYSSSRVFWITRNRWLLMVKYQPLRNLPWLLYGWTRSLLFHLLKQGFTREFIRGLGSGISRTPYALGERSRLNLDRKMSNRELCRLMNRS